MHYDVFSQLLYVSLPNEKVVVKIRPNQENNSYLPIMENTMNKTFEIVAGIMGKTCIGNKICGDGGLAVNAMLAYPKVECFTLLFSSIFISHSCLLTFRELTHFPSIRALQHQRKE